MTEENIFGFRIVGVDIALKALGPKPIDFLGEFYNFDFDTELGVHNEQKIVFNFARITIRDGNSPIPLATYVIACMYDVLNFERNVKLREDGLYDIDHNLEQNLKSVTISTSRGIIWSELRGTYLHNAVMPVIDVRTIKRSKDRQIVGENGEILNTAF